MKDTSGMEMKKEIMKATGLKASEISVIHDKYSGGSSYRVTVKKVYPLSKIKEIAKKRESIDRCQYSGEILSGGNTFVFVQYSWKMELPAEFKALIEHAANQCGFASWQYEDDRIRMVGRVMHSEGLMPGFDERDVMAVIGLYPHAEMSALVKRVA